MLFLVFDLEVVENGFEVILGCEACVQQEAFGAGPFSETSEAEELLTADIVSFHYWIV